MLSWRGQWMIDKRPSVIYSRFDRRVIWAGLNRVHNQSVA